MADEGVGGAVEGHADVHGGVAGPPHVTHLVPAVAHGDPDAGRRPDDAACPLVVQDVQAAVVGQGRFVNEDTAQLGLARHEEGLDEVLLHVDVLVVQLAQGLLVEVGPQAHHGELEEPRHRGRQDVDAAALVLDVEEDPPVGKPVQDACGLLLRHVPDRGGLLRIKGPDGQQRDEFRLPLRKEHAEYPVEKLRRRRTLGELVDALRETVIGVLEVLMGHGRGPIRRRVFAILPKERSRLQPAMKRRG